MKTSTLTKKHAGLSNEEVEQKRAEFGYNEIPEKKVNIFV